MAFLQLNCERRNAGISAPLCEDSFLVALQTKPSPDFDLYADGNSILPQGFEPGSIAIFDLRMNLTTDQRDPFHAIDLYIPHKSLLAMGDDGDIPRHIQELRHTPGATVHDPVLRDLLLSMRPVFTAKPGETSDLFADHVALAIAIHVAHKYGDVSALPQRWGGGLAPWQERRAKELLDAHIRGGITLDVLARSCELSIRHFTRAFRQSIGMSPYEWLQRRRIEKAKTLLQTSSAALSAIAADCGFTDQSHFTRTFSRIVGTTPHVWRRIRRN